MNKSTLILLLLVTDICSAKEFTLNCSPNFANEDVIFVFNEEKNTVSTSGFDEVNASFTDNEIMFTSAGWTHVVNRVTGSMRVSKANGKYFNLSCQLVKSKKF